MSTKETMANKVTGANRLTPFRLEAGREFVSALCAPPSSSAAVVQFRPYLRSPRRWGGGGRRSGEGAVSAEGQRRARFTAGPGRAQGSFL